LNGLKVVRSTLEPLDQAIDVNLISFVIIIEIGRVLHSRRCWVLLLLHVVLLVRVELLFFRCLLGEWLLLPHVKPGVLAATVDPLRQVMLLLEVLFLALNDLARLMSMPCDSFFVIIILIRGDRRELTIPFSGHNHLRLDLRDCIL
jgi:hypothetical protein